MALGLHPEDSDGPGGDISVFGVTHLPLGAPTAWSRAAGPASMGIEVGVEPGDELVVGPDRWKEHRIEKKEGILAKRGGGTSILGSTTYVRRGTGASGRDVGGGQRGRRGKLARDGDARRAAASRSDGSRSATASSAILT
jgi:hypothetical protein